MKKNWLSPLTHLGWALFFPVRLFGDVQNGQITMKSWLVSMAWLFYFRQMIYGMHMVLLIYIQNKPWKFADLLTMGGHLLSDFPDFCVTLLMLACLYRLVLLLFKIDVSVLVVIKILGFSWIISTVVSLVQIDVSSLPLSMTGPYLIWIGALQILSRFINLVWEFVFYVVWLNLILAIPLKRASAASLSVLASETVVKILLVVLAGIAMRVIVLNMETMSILPVAFSMGLAGLLLLTPPIQRDFRQRFTERKSVSSTVN